MSNNGTLFLRRRDLDVMRELIVASLIFFHTARIFDQFSFYVKNEPPELAVTFFVAMAAFWGMPLIFVIAGFAIWHSLQKRTWVAFVRERLLRLFIPWLIGLLLIVPPQVYFKLSSNPMYQESYVQFYQYFFGITFRMDFPWISLATENFEFFHTAHLWFLHTLLAFTLLLLPLFLYLRKTLGRQLVDRAAAHFSGPWAVLLAALPIAMIEAALGTDLAGGWNQIGYVVFLFYGYLLAADVRFWQVLCKYWKISLVLAITSSIACFSGLYIIAEFTHTDPFDAYDLASVMIRFFKGFVGWAWIVAILGFLEHIRKKRESASRWHDSRTPTNNRTFLSRFERYANEAVLPFYILHQTVIVMIGFYVVQWNTSALLKFSIISLTALATTLFLYEIVIKRTRVTRFLFGMKSKTVD